MCADLAYQLSFADRGVDEDFYADVLSLETDEDTTAAGTLRLRLQTTQGEDGQWSYLDDDRLALFTKVSFAMGYSFGGGLAGALGGIAGSGGNDTLQPVFDGYVTSLDLSLGSAPGDTAVEITAIDTSVLLSLEDKVAAWPNLSDGDIVQQVVSAYGIQVRSDSTPTVHQEDQTTIVQRGTDLQFVRSLARRNGLEFYFETDKRSKAVVAFLHAPQLDGTPQDDLAIQFGDESNLKSFTVHVHGDRPLAVKTAQVDVEAGSPTTGEAPDSELQALGDKNLPTLAEDALGRLVTPKEALAQMLVLGPPTSDATELRTIAQAVRDEAAWFITATGEVNSDAYQTILRPRRTVLVKGAGSQYSGTYYVTGVSHRISGDGSYTQSFRARRNARDVTGSEPFGGGGLAVSIPGA